MCGEVCVSSLKEEMPGRFCRIFGNRIFVCVFEPVERVIVPFVVRDGGRH